MRTEIYTYFTVPDGETKLLYSAENLVRVTVQLENAGPVAVGQREDISPVLSGKGMLLPPGNTDDKTFVLSKENRLYIVSESVNRVKFIVEPIPFLEKILAATESIVGIAGSVARRALKAGGRR